MSIAGHWCSRRDRTMRWMIPGLILHSSIFSFSISCNRHKEHRAVGKFHSRGLHYERTKERKSGRELPWVMT